MENEMRILIAAVSLVAMTGAAFAGEPQKTTATRQTVVASAQKAPAKMTDQQLDKVVAGADTSGVTLVTNSGNDVKNVQCVASTSGGGNKGSSTNSGAIFYYNLCGF
jgi:hypothetical protein